MFMIKASTDMLLVNCIYAAPEGEGVRIGTPQVFLRLQGCAIGCVNCDTKESWDFDAKYARSLESILSEIEKFSLKTLSITGGDPLDPRHTPALLNLIQELKKREYFINIEASGSRIVPEIFDRVDFISFDFKTPSTEVKMPVKNIFSLAENYAHKSQLKSVIAHQKDFSAVYQLYSDHPELKKLQWVLTPCFEPLTKFPTQLIKNIIEWNSAVSAPFRIILQQHKVVYGPDVREV